MAKKQDFSVKNITTDEGNDLFTEKNITIIAVIIFLIVLIRIFLKY